VSTVVNIDIIGAMFTAFLVIETILFVRRESSR
jgi:hypothetical protein